MFCLFKSTVKINCYLPWETICDAEPEKTYNILRMLRIEIVDTFIILIVYLLLETQKCSEIMTADSELPNDSVTIDGELSESARQLSTGEPTDMPSDSPIIVVDFKSEENVGVDGVKLTSDGDKFTTVVTSVDSEGLKTIIATLESTPDENGKQFVYLEVPFEATEVILAPTTATGDKISLGVTACIHPSGEYYYH